MLTGLKRVARRAIDPDWRPGALVLLYHRVADLASDPQQLAVSPDRFDAHLAILARDTEPMPLKELTERAAAGSAPARAVAITFDDGYADTLHAATPLLTARRLPATVFITTGVVADGGEFWWDAIERLVLSPAGPTRIRLSLDGGSQLHDRGLALYRALCERAKTMTVGERTQLLGELAAQIDANPRRDADRALSRDEVAALAAVAGVTVGSHTVSHQSLAPLDGESQRREIGGGRRAIEQWTASTATMMSYPFGGDADVSDDVESIARDEGVTLACTTRPGRVNGSTNALRVPRLIVRDWDADAFRSQLQEWLS